MTLKNIFTTPLSFFLTPTLIKNVLAPLKGVIFLLGLLVLSSTAYSYHWELLQGDTYYCVTKGTVVDVSFCPPIHTHLAQEAGEVARQGLNPGGPQCRVNRQIKVDPTPLSAQTQLEIWNLVERGEMDKAHALKQKLEHYMQNYEHFKVSKLGGGITDTRLVTFPNGIKAVFKPEDGGQYGNEHFHEIAAYSLDSKLGFNLTPTTILGSVGDKMGSLQFFMEGTTAYKKGNIRAPSETMQVFDFLTNNCDRHLENFMVNPNGRLIAIDNGFAFSQRYCDLLRQNNGTRQKDGTITQYPQYRMLSPHAVPRPERIILDQLQRTTPEMLKASLETYLTPAELQNILNKREFLLNKFLPQQVPVNSPNLNQGRVLPFYK